MMQHSCTICLGSNTPDQEEQIKKAIEHLKEQLSEVEVSATYRSAAYNGKDAPYLNAVVHGYTDRSIEQMETDLKLWEKKQGRTAEMRSEGKVPIDLDLVIWCGRIMRQVDFERHYFNEGYRELLARGVFEMM
jgi:7,8-dihydro-6-hydroxymethylpterin-pyrophosphokinase